MRRLSTFADFVRLHYGLACECPKCGRFVRLNLAACTDRETGSPLESCTIVTGTAASAIHDIHPRMPIPVADAAWDEWLDTTRSGRDKLLELLRAGPNELFEAWPVSRAVNAPRNQGPQLVERI